MSGQTFTTHFESPEQTAVDCLALASGISKQKIKDAMAKGAVWTLQQKKQVRLRRASKTAKPGTPLILYYDEYILAQEPPEPQCLYATKQYSVWYKPSGLHSQGTQWGDHCSLLRWVEKAHNEAFLIHRLDADASGIVIVAHNGKAAAELSNLFQTRAIEKYYEAWVAGEWKLAKPNYEINIPLDDKNASTEITSSRTEQGATLLSIQLHTGRKHQIRRHLQLEGFPIVGDKLYGKGHRLPLQLCAYRIKFNCPMTGKTLDIQLEPTYRLSQTLNE